VMSGEEPFDESTMLDDDHGPADDEPPRQEAVTTAQ
jgi:hypothetical protein